MLPPSFCSTCYQALGRNHAYVIFLALLRAGKTQDEALDTVKLERACCRTMFLSHVEQLGAALAARRLAVDECGLSVPH